MNKKLISVMTLPLMVAMVGCGETATSAAASNNGSVSSNTESKTSVAESSTTAHEPLIKEPTTITLWSITGKNNQEALQSYIDEFEKEEPNVTVNNVIQTGMSYNELKEAVIKGFSVGSYPDMVQCYPDHVAEYIKYGKAVNLDPYINNAEYGWTEEDNEDIYQTFITEGQEYATEGTYSVPYCKSTEAMYYNADVLIGLDLSAYDSTINKGNPLTAAYLDDLTWEELFEHLCPAIVDYNNDLPDNQKILKSDQDYSAVFAYDSDDNLFITLAKQYGIAYTSVDNTTGKGKFDFGEGEAKTKMETLLKKWAGYAKKGYIISKGSAGNNYTNTYFTKQNTLFSVGSTGGYKYQFDTTNPMNVGVAKLPHAEGKDEYIINQGPSLTILDNGSENQKLASWLLYKTITNKENSLDWALSSGYMGIRKSNAESEDYEDASDYKSKDPKTIDRLSAYNMAYSGRADVLSSLFVSPAFVGSSTARTQVGAIITKVLTKTNDADKDIDTWFTDAYNQCLLAL
jgi:multiple sugar transport system substrate-binding protein